MEVPMWSSRDEHTGAGSSPWHAAGHERPVFLDEHGRRHRLLRLFGGLAVLLAAGWLAGLVAGATGFATLAPMHAPVAGRVLVPQAFVTTPTPTVAAPAASGGAGRARAVRVRIRPRVATRPIAVDGARRGGDTRPAADRS
jgi:hypothetical protein